MSLHLVGHKQKGYLGKCIKICVSACETERVELCWFFCMDCWERHVFKEIDLWFKIELRTNEGERKSFPKIAKLSASTVEIA